MIAGEDITARGGEVEGFTFGETKVDDFNLFIGSLAGELVFRNSHEERVPFVTGLIAQDSILGEFWP